MKIEICDNTRMLAIVAVVALAIVYMVCTSLNGYSQRTLKALESGYIERQGMGTQQILWQKP